MAKTLVTAAHEHGPMQNGQGNCFARWGNHGVCPGVERAAWLNGLGEDDEYFIKPTARCPAGTTNGQVRDNYIREMAMCHVVPIMPRLASLKAEERRTAAALRHVRREIKRIEVETAAGTPVP